MSDAIAKLLAAGPFVVTVAEAAALLRVQPSTIRRRLRTGELRAMQGYPYRIVLADLCDATKTRRTTRGVQPSVLGRLGNAKLAEIRAARRAVTDAAETLHPTPAPLF